MNTNVEETFIDIAKILHSTKPALSPEARLSKGDKIRTSIPSKKT